MPRYSILTEPVGAQIRSEPQILVALPASPTPSVMPPWAAHPDGAFLVIGCAAQRSAPSMPVSGREMPSARPTPLNVCSGPNRWNRSYGGFVQEPIGPQLGDQFRRPAEFA